MEALGLIETKGFIGAIVAADTAVKAADVTLLNAEKIKGGYVTVQLDGDVGAVKAAVEAAIEAIQPFGTLVSSHVIPRMHMETTRLINTKMKDEKLLNSQPEEIEDTTKIEESEQAVKISDKEEEKAPIKDTETEEKQTSNDKKAKETASDKRKELEKMTVHELRKLVREKNAMKDDSGRIKYAKKTELINRLLNRENKSE